MLVAFAWTVFYAFRHGIGFPPNDIRAQYPPLVLQCERHSPRDAEQVLRRTVWTFPAVRFLHMSVQSDAVLRPVAAVP